MKHRVIALTVVIVVGVLTFGYLTSFLGTFFIKADANSEEKFFSKNMPSIQYIDGLRISDNKSQFKIAPVFEKIGESIKPLNNYPPLTMGILKGKVVLVNFWTYSCINVLRTIPHLIDWNTKYADKGLVIVGVHTPEFEFEKNSEYVKTSLQKYGIKYPVIQDNNYNIWNAYGNNYWPRMYLVDDKGFVRYDRVGEGEYNQTEKVIQSLLAERNSDKGIKNMDDVNTTTFSYENKSHFNSTKNIRNFLEQPVDFSKIKTPELYFGNQGSNSAVGNSEGFQPEQTVTYTVPSINSSIIPNTIYLEGKWKNNHDNLELQSDTGRIILNYSAKSVNLVAGGRDQGIVYEDNSLLPNNFKGVDTKNNNSQFVIDYPRLYNIVNHQSYYDDGFHSLVIDVKGKGFQAYVFTFG
jgi:thiol-disulfide isomerase/thioredoxin